MSVLLDWKKKKPIFKTGQNFFSLLVVLVLPLPHDINAILISLVEGKSEFFKSYNIWLGVVNQC